MNDYGLVALLARKYCVNETARDPLDAWNKAAAQIFPRSNSSQKKSCPKGAFLGLCDRGWIDGVRGGDSPPNKNGEYAILAVEALRQNDPLKANPGLLWETLKLGIRHNHQADVVVALWNANWITK